MSDRSDPELLELETLMLLDRASSPVGAARLAAAWQEAGLSGAEATAGRYLRQLDASGFTHLHRATRGRTLTETGRIQLHRLVRRKRQGEHDAQLWGAVNATDVADLIDLLAMRRMVEAEAARLAAVRASDEEIARLVEVANAQVGDLNQDHETTVSSMNFHRLVAEASHNRIIMAVALLLLDPVNDPLEKALEYISLDAGATRAQVSDHSDLADALQRRDSIAAKRIMNEHMDKLIHAVTSYREKFRETDRARVELDLSPGASATHRPSS